MREFYSPFILPFVVGTVFLLVVIVYKWGSWVFRLSRKEKNMIWRGIPTAATLKAAWEVVMESLLHRKIFRVNPVLGYMHMSLAFGWFLLISVGMVEAAMTIGLTSPLHAHVFYRFFDTEIHDGPHMMAHIMDALLLFVLSGVALAWLKRLRSRILGMKKTTRHVLFDKLALSALWFIFPLRLTAESFMAAIKHNGGFLTGTLGNMIAAGLPLDTIVWCNDVAWWCYSFALGLFFVAMPFSRYMHIFTEIPLIFLRHYKLQPKDEPSSLDEFQLQACSRCGICIDPCQLQSQAGINNVQSVYAIRDRRYGWLTEEVADNCLMCGRCEVKCPVGLDLNTLRLSGRAKMRNRADESRYDYINGLDRSSGEGNVGYFAGCMTLLTPAVMQAMEKIFAAVGENVWFADRDGGVCCGRPQKLSGAVNAARQMMEYNKKLFRDHDIKVLVTSCPICLRVFKEDYDMPEIEVLHHSEYIRRMAKRGRLVLHKTGESYTYHDPCELGRGSGIYDEPRDIIRSLGTLIEPNHSRENALCCGSSLANTAITDQQQRHIADAVAAELEATGATQIVTACPLCKKAIARGTERPIVDLAQVVADSL